MQKTSEARLSIYLGREAKAALLAEAERIDRPVSWIVQRALKIAASDLAAIPTEKEPFVRSRRTAQGS